MKTSKRCSDSFGQGYIKKNPKHSKQNHCMCRHDNIPEWDLNQQTTSQSVKTPLWYMRTMFPEYYSSSCIWDNVHKTFRIPLDLHVYITLKEFKTLSFWLLNHLLIHFYYQNLFVWVKMPIYTYMFTHRLIRYY